MSYVNRGSVLAIGVTFIMTSIAAVGARFAVRIHKRMIGIDDWLCLIAMFLVIGECVVLIVGYATHSIGTHTPPLGQALLKTVDPSQQMLKKLEFVAYCLFIPALTLLKLSTLFFYKRLFRGKAFAVAFWCLATLSVLWGVSFLIAWVASCQHVQDRWISIATFKANCLNTFKVLICQSVFDVAVDLGLLMLPIPFVFALQMPLKRKIAVSVTLIVGALAIGCGLYRMVIVFQTLAVPFLANPTVAGMRSDDRNGIVSVLLIWSMLELGVGMVAVCLPTLRLLLQKQSRKSIAQGLHSLVVLRSLSARTSRKTIDSEQISVGSENQHLQDLGQTGILTKKASSDATTINSVGAHGDRGYMPSEHKIVVHTTVDVSTVS